MNRSSVFVQEQVFQPVGLGLALAPGIDHGVDAWRKRGPDFLLVGQQPRTLSLIWLKNNEVPWSWDDQQRLFGRMDG